MTNYITFIFKYFMSYVCEYIILIGEFLDMIKYFRKAMLLYNQKGQYYKKFNEKIKLKEKVKLFNYLFKFMTQIRHINHLTIFSNH